MVYMSYMRVMLGLRTLLILIDTCFYVMIYASILKILYVSEISLKDICLEKIKSDYIGISKNCFFETNIAFFLHLTYTIIHVINC